jgi:N-acetyl-gamma-glutamyl-phosphate reductase
LIRTGIVGGTGYTGVELLRLLAQHPQAQLCAITSRTETGLPVSTLFPNLRGHARIADLTFSTPDDGALWDCDVVFFATPHGVAMAQAPELLEAGVKVIDLAADFRLKDPTVFAQWYGMAHTQTGLLTEAVYGLPEVNREAIRTARLVGLPGCYPTSVQLGLLPVLEAGLVDCQTLIANCASGVSGAGRKAEVGTLLAEAADNFKAYGVVGHRHAPEITQGLTAIAGRSVQIQFVPHLVPMIRGIHSTLYARVLPTAREVDFQALYEARFAHEPFVDVMPPGSTPETRSVRASNMVRIAVHRPAGSDLLIVLVVEDNLVKGAAGQAVQVMNLLFGLEETAGLTQLPILP